MTAKPLTISRILIGDPRPHAEPDNILVPVVDVRVLAENGAMFSRTFLAFGLDRARVIAAWEREPEKFLKVDLQPSQSQSASQPACDS
jgi:hypothetical protein